MSDIELNDPSENEELVVPEVLEQVSLADWLEKAEYEGGVLEGFDYGLTADEIQPNMDDREAIAAIYRLEAHWDAMQEDLQLVEDLIETEES